VTEAVNRAEALLAARAKRANVEAGVAS